MRTAKTLSSSIHQLSSARSAGFFSTTLASFSKLVTFLLRWLAISGLFITTALTFSGGLTGTGDTKGPMYISLVAQVALPIGLLLVLQNLMELQPHHIWMAILCGHMTRAVLTVIRFRAGKWRAIKIEA